MKIYQCPFPVQSNCADCAESWRSFAVELQEELNVPAWYFHLSDRSESIPLQPVLWLFGYGKNKQAIHLFVPPV